VKIAMVYDAVYPDHIGGGERRYWELARRLVGCGHEVWLVSMQHWDGPARIRRQGVTLAGVCPAIPLFTARGGRSMVEPVYFAWHLNRFLRREPFDLIDCAAFPYLSCIAAWRRGRQRRSPLVVTWFEIRGWRGWWRYSGPTGAVAALWEAVVARLSPHNVAISDLTLAQAGALYPRLRRRMDLVPCGVESGHRAGPGRDPARRFRLLYVGRLVAHKRVEWAIEVLAGLVAAYPRLTLTIVGEGPEAGGLERLVAQQCLTPRVTFRGRLEADELAGQYQMAGILLSPSQQEGFGMVLVEAMAAGVAVIAADAPQSAAGEVLDGGQAGVLVTSAAAMREAVRALLDDPCGHQELAARGVARAQGFDWDGAVVPALERVYARVLGLAADRPVGGGGAS
jgi:glycosyltransferase involved in cell wall biosynthesis